LRLGDNGHPSTRVGSRLSHVGAGPRACP
jgi:hypothetical protein